MAITSTEAEQANSAETKLLESALGLFSDKGYEGTSIREIIEGAGVTRPVLYYYFENKEDLFRRIVEKKYAELITIIEEIIRKETTCQGRLKKIISRSFELAEENTQTVNLILQVFFSPPQQGPPLDKMKLAHQRFRLIERVMQDGLSESELSGGDAQSLALVFLGIMDMHIMAKSNRPETKLTREHAESLVDLFVNGAVYRDKPKSKLQSPYSF